MERLGSDYGGWWVPSSLLSASSLCYCAGVGTDITFDMAIMQNYDCEVWAFDPTPASIEWADRQDTPPSFHFIPVGLWNENQRMQFFVPADEAHISHSILNVQGTSQYFEGECRRLISLMAELGHTHIDLLKLDIEGAETTVLTDLLASQVRPSILCVEFDAPEIAWKTRARIRRVLTAGYSLVYVEGWNYTFVSNSIGE
jgi:FkbM family methyltransferase